MINPPECGGLYLGGEPPEVTEQLVLEHGELLGLHHVYRELHQLPQVVAPVKHVRLSGHMPHRLTLLTRLRVRVRLGLLCNYYGKISKIKK